MDSRILNTPLTRAYIAQHLQRSIGHGAVIAKIQPQRIAEGRGFASTVIKLTLTYDETSPQSNFPSSVVVKSPNVTALRSAMGARGEKRVLDSVIPIIHNRECDFYESFSTTCPIPMAKVYAAVRITDDDEKPGMIILEDLSLTSSVTPELAGGLNYDQVASACVVLARFHAWSLRDTDRSIKFPTSEERERMMRGMTTSTAAQFRSVQEKYPDRFGSPEIIERLVELTSSEMTESIMNEHREFMDDVLCHGDFHFNNIMYEKRQDGSVSKNLTAVVDFQALMRACPMYDLARLFSFSISSRLRREHCEKFLRLYYDEMISILGDDRHESDQTHRFRFEMRFDQMRRIFDRQFASAVIKLVSYLPMLLAILCKKDSNEEKIVLESMFENFRDAKRIFGIDNLQDT